MGLHFLGLQQGFDQLVSYAEGHHGTPQLQLVMLAPLLFLFLLCFIFEVIFVFWNLFFEKLFLKLSCVCLSLEKLVNEKHFPIKKNLAWFLGKYFPRKFRRKTLSESCEKFKNIILFDDYIKFDSQTFDCYIYIHTHTHTHIYIYCFEYLFFNFIS